MDNKKNNEKKSFVQKKDCAIYSLKNVEYFLRNINKSIKCINIYKILK